MKTITQINSRISSEGQPIGQPIVVERTPADAFDAIIDCVLAFGAMVTGGTDTCIVLETRVFGCVDITMVEGPAEDLKPLREVCLAFQDLRRIADSAELFKDSENSALRKIFHSNHLKGALSKTFARAAIASRLTKDLDQQKRLMNDVKLSDMIALAQLVFFNGVPFEETLELA